MPKIKNQVLHLIIYILYDDAKIFNKSPLIILFYCTVHRLNFVNNLDLGPTIKLLNNHRHKSQYSRCRYHYTVQQ